MSQTDFEIAYDGEAVADGSMDIHDLAPALLAAGKLLRRANYIINGDSTTVRVRVKTAPPPGSFPVDLQLHLATSQQLSAVGAPEAYQLLTVVGLVEIGKHAGTINNLLDLFKKLRGKKPEVVPGDGADVIVSIDGEQEQVVVNNYVLNLYGDEQIQKHVRGMLDPVTKPGVKEFQVRKQGRIVRRVTKAEADDIVSASRGRDDDDQLNYGSFTKWVYATPKWQEGHQWRFRDNQGNSFSAKVVDEDFWERVHADEVSFTEHTQLRVRAEWSQERDSNGKITLKHIVTKILTISPADDDRQDSFLSHQEEGGGTDEQ